MSGILSPADVLGIANQTDSTRGATEIGFAQGGVGSLAAYLANTTQIVSSVAAIRKLLKTGVPNANTLGYYSSGDGGQGTYHYNSSDTTSGAVYTGSITAITAPVAPTLSSTAGGTLAAMTYFVKVTYVTAAGETRASTEASLAVALDFLLMVTSPVAMPGATGYNVYVSTATGTETKQNSTPIAIGTNWTEPMTGLVMGMVVPSVSTAGSLMTVTAVSSGALAVGMTVNLSTTGATIGYISGFDTGAGNTGTYTISTSITESSQFFTSDTGGSYLVAADGGRWYIQMAGVANVKQFGAKGDGIANDTYAVQAAVVFSDSVWLPDGTYLLATISASPQPGYYNPQNILIQNKNNFRVWGGKDVTLVPANGANYSCIFTIYNCQNWKIQGLNLQGNRTGLTSGQESVGINTASYVNFTIDDIHFTGNWGDSGAAFGGDWLVKGRWSNITADQIGQGFDTAFMQDCVFENIDLTGYSIVTGGAGNVGLGINYDQPASANNATGISFTNTNNLYFKNFRARNFNNGALITTGSYLYFDSLCDFSNNPGTTSGAVGGKGVVITYNNGGAFSSVGFPVNHVYFNGSKISNNGATVPGSGAVLNGAAITNSDLIANIFFLGAAIDNNASTGINSTGEAHLSGVVIQNCAFTGAMQTTPISAGILNSMVTSALPRNASVLNNYGFNPTYLAFPGLPAGTGAGFTVVNTNPFPVQVTIQTDTSAAYQPVLVNPSALGSTFTILGTVAINSGPCIFTLLPGMGVYFNTNVPGGWAWCGL